jgi:hypothetical protein
MRTRGKTICQRDVIEFTAASIEAAKVKRLMSYLLISKWAKRRSETD